MEGLFEILKQSLESGQAIAYPVALLAGILTSFTPCVYPVIPITIGFIGARSTGSKGKGFMLSLCYVIGIAITYSILGGIAAFTGSLFGQISRSPITYLVIANICVILGISMLGVFELKLPSFQFKGIKGKGLFSAFAMGMASGLIMGPCTAPVLAVILTYVAAKQNLIYGTTILFTFAFGMGFLLIVLGTFTGIIVSMPKAGPWMDRIKKAFGWILIIVGQYFLFTAGRLSI
ncbi:MAG: cytochrome c biogenesis protein CcdA [Candidatus Omnitrophota bacterium]